MVRKKFTVRGMTCSSCSAHVEHSVSKLDGVASVQVNLMGATMHVEYDDAILSENDIINTVNSGGFVASIYEKNRAFNVENEKQEKKKFKKLVASIVLMIVLMYFSMGEMLNLPLPKLFENHKYIYINGLIQLVLVIPIIILNSHYYTNGFKRLIKLSPNMDSLVALGSVASLIYGLFSLIMLMIGSFTNNHTLIEEYHMQLYFESAGMILALVSLGKYIENKSKGKTTKAISKLLDLAPKTAILLKDNEELEINVDDIKIDDVIIIKPGTNIPIDGIVINGTSSVNESSLTGESIPVLKEKDCLVKSGTINLNGVLYIKATCESSDTTLQKIIDLVEVASNSKAPIARLADKVSLYFVPIVILISIISFIIWMIVGKPVEFSLARAISVLVISCPCALGLATPIAIMLGTYKAVDFGILFKSGVALETLHKVDTIVFDKTGTLTYGMPKITDIYPYNITEEELVKVAYSVEKNSEHPVAFSINTYAEENNIEPYETTNFENIIGYGVKATINNDIIQCVKKEMVNIKYDNNIYTKFTNEGKSVIFVIKNNELLGMIALKDVVKPTSINAIKNLKQMKKTPIMLTGDNELLASIVAKECGIDIYISGVLPDQKANEIEKLKKEGKVVAMVGDGINDSVALTTSSVGIAIGSGTDVAIESAQAVLMNDDLNNIITMLKLSDKVINNIKMNLFWAFFYNILFIPIAAGALYPLFNIVLNPMICALSMSLSSICVVLNTLRITRFKKGDF